MGEQGTFSVHNISDWLVVIQIGLTLLGGAFLVWMRRNFIPREEADRRAVQLGHKFDELEGRIGRMTERLNAGDAKFDLVELRLKSLPTAADIHAMSVGLEKLNGNVAVTNERLSGLKEAHDGLRAQVSVIDEFMRSHQ